MPERAERDIGKMLVIATLDPLAEGLLLFGLPWIALTLRRSVAEAAALGIASTVAYVVTLAVSGSLGDRLGHRRTLQFSAGAQTAVALVVAIALWRGADVLPPLLGLGLAIGAGRSLTVTSTYAATAAIVDAVRMPLAFAHLTVGREIGVFGGAALGGVIYGLGRTPALITTVVVACAVTWLMAARLSSPYQVVAGITGRTWRRRLGDMLGNRRMRLLLISNFVWNLPTGASLSLAVPLMHNQVHFSSFATSVVLGAGAVGSVAVAPMMRALGGHTNLTRLSLLGMAAQAGLLVALAAVVDLALVIPVYALMMMSITTVSANLLTARSQKVAVERQATLVGLGLFIGNLGYMVGGGLAVLLARGLTLPLIFVLLGASLMGMAVVFGLLLGRSEADNLLTIDTIQVK